MCFTLTPFLRRARYFCIAGAFFLLLSVFFLLRSSGARPAVVKVKVVPVETSRRAIDIPPVEFASDAFYRTIIDNNLFRPLGWRPPRPIEPYRLIGTILPHDKNTPPKAIIETTAGQKTYIVTIGDKIETHTEVVDIQPKQVTLSTDEKQRTLKLPIRF